MSYKPKKGAIQPIVFYDKDNKAIDVSGIEELSSIKIDTGKIAGDLELVKDNQGRLYGKYEEAWIPVKVDSEGRPIIASDVTVNAEGMVVDLGQIKQGPAGTEPWPVQLSGANVEIVKIFDAVAITTTSTISSNLISLNRYKTGTFVLYHTLDAELVLFPQFGATLNSYIHVDGEWKSTTVAPITIPPMSSQGRMMLNTHPTYKDVFSSGLHSVRFVVKAKTAPTSGSLTLEYWGSIR